MLPDFIHLLDEVGQPLAGQMLAHHAAGDRTRSPRGSIELEDGRPHFLVDIFHLSIGLQRADTVVEANPVPMLAAQQLVDGHARRLARQVPERRLDGTDRMNGQAAIEVGGGGAGVGLGDHAAVEHLHVCRVLPQQHIPQRQHVGLDLGGGGGITIPLEALGGIYPHQQPSAGPRPPRGLQDGSLDVSDRQRVALGRAPHRTRSFRVVGGSWPVARSQWHARRPAV